ncbi:MAG: NYN domain-containing protein, partial [Candidatus Brocadiae bacterium]|nr:NYN domain-containing protein [Candidatus Brocadiia bacterium]
MADMGQSLALFVDFENLALGFTGTRKRFEIDKVLDRLVTKGKILVKKAYADWTRFGDYRRELHESSIELIEIPKRSQVGKNSADIRLCVDALDLCYSKAHIDTFCILSGDSDFSPLVSKLRENGKSVIGVGMKASTSSLLVEGCDEFIYYEDMERHEKVTVSAPVSMAGSPADRKAEALQLVMDTVAALKRDGREVLWGSLVKDTIKRRKPQFDHTYHGYRTWSELLEDAQRRGLMSLTIDSKSGTYVISSFTPTTAVPPAPAGPVPASRELPRRDNGGGRHG